MKKEIIVVPKDKCPLDTLADMGERTKNAWIFIHENAYKKLKGSNGCKASFSSENDTKNIWLEWEATDKYPATSVLIHIPASFGWGEIISVEAEDIAFTNSPDDPEDIFFLKMEE